MAVGAWFGVGAHHVQQRQAQVKLCGGRGGSREAEGRAAKVEGQFSKAAPWRRGAARALTFLTHTHSRPPPRFLSPLAADAIAGAAGEVAQIVCLYPLDTLKVICQAADCSPRAALALLAPRGAPRGALLTALYRGCGPAAISSAAVGAVYLVTFSLARRATARATAETSVSSLPPAATPSADGTPPPPPPPSPPSAAAATGAAAVGAVACSVATALMEAPLELFRHRTQAGVGGGLRAQAAAALAAGGVSELYRGFFPYLIKSLPYDVAELVSYCALRDVVSALPAAFQPPPSFAPTLVGALAGAAAVVASMPADCVKLRLELSSAPVAHGVRASVSQFVGTARGMAATGGAPAFFRGLTPRLAEKVPSTMVYWATVEGVRKSLAPYLTEADDGVSFSPA